MANGACRRAVAGSYRRVDPMRAPTAEHAHLAGAYLALADDPELAPAQRSFPRSLCALAAGLVLAFAAPLAWASSGKPRDLPAATASGKAAAVVADDDDGDGGDGPGDATNGIEGVQAWAATIG
jgi:hypothetical protein